MRDASSHWQCVYFWKVYEKEADADDLTDGQRQIRNLQRNELECFALLTFEVARKPGSTRSRKLQPTQRSSPRTFSLVEPDSWRCYERRRHCLEQFGWCRVDGIEYGYCSETNYLPDKPAAQHPLTETLTFVKPAQVELPYTTSFMDAHSVKLYDVAMLSKLVFSGIDDNLHGTLDQGALGIHLSSAP